MNKFLKVGVMDGSEGIKTLEEQLHTVLVPIEPRTEYVHELRRNLLKESELEFSEPKPALGQKVVLTVAGLLSGTLLLMLGVRGVIALLNSRGAIQQLKNGIQGEKTAPLNPAA
jgi:hypothetical protein